MKDPFFVFFEKDRPRVNADLPAWKNVPFKEYLRSFRILLPKKPLPNISLEKSLYLRKTEHEFSNSHISLEDLGALLYGSIGLIHKNRNDDRNLRRPYPSGGSRYPIELYIVCGRIKEVEGGVYHYNFLEHALEKINGANIDNIYQVLPYDFAKEAPALILLSFIGKRTIEKYGSLGYKLGLLEGGHIGQNIYLVGAALGLGVSALGSVDFQIVEKELSLGQDESLFYQFAVGWPKNQ